LNIGLDSMVLFDDSAAERAMVRRLQPAVAVPEVPADPADFVSTLDRQRYFEVPAISAEDLARNRHYQADANRQTLASSTSDLNSFLQSLQMKARIESVMESSLERAAQLINRSNQYNLTTRRHSAAALADLRLSSQWLTRTVSLTDRFGDTGLISIVLAREEHDALAIDTWLMSCRVLQRGVERMLLNNIVACALSRGLRRIRGEFVATTKNGLVRDHYRRLGFAPRKPPGPDHSIWELVIDESWTPLEHFIHVEDNGA
jgi:FkbH-like protein